MATIWLVVVVACMGVGIALMLNPPTPLRGIALMIALLACTHVAHKQFELYVNMMRRLEEKEKEHDDA